MTPEEDRALLSLLPGVDLFLLQVQGLPVFRETPREILVAAIRETLAFFRATILSGAAPLTREDLGEARLLSALGETVARLQSPSLRPVVNATGVILHTNLGRAPLARGAIEHLAAVAKGYSNLEFDLATGTRGARDSLVEDLLCRLTGAEAAMVVNNNAAAVLLCLDTVARGREAVVSRGELVEIGGSFRVPDVMAKSGAILKEVGTTNRTHLRDYEQAIGPDTGLLLKVHTSNFQVVGFTAAVSLGELTSLGRRYTLPVMEDLGSGTLVDFSEYGLPREPTVQASVAAGADLITFSGDKLLGGPQAGIILGKETLLREIRENPLARALRIDKLTLAALEATLRLYLDEKTALSEIPVLRMLTLSEEVLARRAEGLSLRLKRLDPSRITLRVSEAHGKAGGGALPLLELPGRCIALQVAGVSARALEEAFRTACPPVIGRIEADRVLLDLRTVAEEEETFIESALLCILTQTPRTVS